MSFISDILLLVSMSALSGKQRRGGGELDGRAGELVVIVVVAPAAPVPGGAPRPSANVVGGPHDPREPRCGRAAELRGRRRRGPALRRLRAAAVELVLRRLRVVPSPRQAIHEILPVRRPSEGGGGAYGCVTVSSLEWLRARGWSDLLRRRKPVVINAVWCFFFVSLFSLSGLQKPMSTLMCVAKLYNFWRLFNIIWYLVVIIYYLIWHLIIMIPNIDSTVIKIDSCKL
jgi:hypothetical protein